MLFEERLEAAERRRADGNRLFHEGKLPEALGKYALVSDAPASASCRGGPGRTSERLSSTTAVRAAVLSSVLCQRRVPAVCPRPAARTLRQALSYTDEDFCLQLEGAHLDKANAVMVPVYLNTAAAHLKLGDYGAAIQNCAQVGAWFHKLSESIKQGTKLNCLGSCMLSRGQGQVVACAANHSATTTLAGAGPRQG